MHCFAVLGLGLLGGPGLLGFRRWHICLRERLWGHRRARVGARGTLCLGDLGLGDLDPLGWQVVGDVVRRYVVAIENEKPGKGVERPGHQLVEGKVGQTQWRRCRGLRREHDLLGRCGRRVSA